MYRTDTGVPRGVSPSLVDKVSSRAIVQHSTNWYLHGIIPSVGTEKLLVHLSKKHTRSKLPFTSVRLRLVVFGVESFLLFRVREKHFDKGAGELVTSRCPQANFPNLTQ